MPEQLTLLPEPIKSENDRKGYRSPVLNNGLRVVLVSDSEFGNTTTENNESYLQLLIKQNENVDNENENSDNGKENIENENTTNENAKNEKENAENEKENTENENPENENENTENSDKKSAAALNVNVETYSDPDDIIGLAHFVERMLFMGSVK